MIRLTTLLTESREEEIQQFVDMLSMYDTKSPMFKKYYDMLLSKYGVDFHKLNRDDEYIKNVDLSNIKNKTDFLNWDNYIKYAIEVYKLRKINIKLKGNRELSFNDAKRVIENMGVNVKYKKYTGSGNYAEASGNTITLSDTADLGTVIHELGHIYDYNHYKDGISKVNTNASSSYGIKNGGEVFAENFTHFFMNPSELKKKLPEVYSDLNKRISGKWKSNINTLL